MKAYIVASGHVIAPFGDPVHAIPIGGETLRSHQEKLLRRHGFSAVHVDAVDEVPTDEDRLVVRDDLYFTRRILKDLVARWDRRPQQVSLPAGSAFWERFHDLQDAPVVGDRVLFELFLLPRGAPNAVGSVFVPIFRERAIEMNIPPQITGRSVWVHPLTSSVCLNIRHWLHVLSANLLSIQVRWVDRVLTRPWTILPILLRAALFQKGPWWARCFGAANVVGRGVRIHPTARVEGSFLGDGVTVGPQALVMGSMVGAGSTIQERVNLSYSVIGQDSFVSKHSVVYACAAFERAELCMKGMQLCLVGRDAALTARATPIDVQPGGKIRVMHRGEVRQIDQPVLGSCYGHGAFVGAGILVGAGRALPNGTRVVADPSTVLLRIPDTVDPEAAYVVRNGQLVRLAEVKT